MNFSGCNHSFVVFSGVYPLFRHSAADLQGAALRVHITLTAGSVPAEVPAAVDTQMDSDNQEELLSDEVETADRAPSPTTPKKSPRGHKNKSSGTATDITSVQHTEMSMDESFPVTVAVDQAMHLNLKGEVMLSNLLSSTFFELQNTYNDVCIMFLWQAVL